MKQLAQLRKGDIVRLFEIPSDQDKPVAVELEPYKIYTVMGSDSRTVELSRPYIMANNTIAQLETLHLVFYNHPNIGAEVLADNFIGGKN